MNLLADLQTLAEAFASETESTLGSVSHRIFADSKRLDRAFGGKATLTLTSYERAMLWFSEHWPDGADWPEGIERPAAAGPSGSAALRASGDGEGAAVRTTHADRPRAGGLDRPLPTDSHTQSRADGSLGARADGLAHTTEAAE